MREDNEEDVVVFALSGRAIIRRGGGGIMGNLLVLGGDRGFRSPEAEPT